MTLKRSSKPMKRTRMGPQTFEAALAKAERADFAPVRRSPGTCQASASSKGLSRRAGLSQRAAIKATKRGAGENLPPEVVVPRVGPGQAVAVVFKVDDHPGQDSRAIADHAKGGVAVAAEQCTDPTGRMVVINTKQPATGLDSADSTASMLISEHLPVGDLSESVLFQGTVSGVSFVSHDLIIIQTLTQWANLVIDRDGNRCQWSRCEFCRNVVSACTLDPHHKALRSARPDLRLVLANGVTICRRRHDWVHSSEGRADAIARGFLNLRTRELAAKEGTLGEY